MTIDLKLLLIAALYLAGGVGLGSHMAINDDFLLAPAHAHLNLLGWVSCAIFGLFYRLYPQAAATRLAKLHFMLSVASALLFPVGIAISILTHDPLLAIAGSLGWAAAVLCFVGIVAIEIGRAGRT